MSKWTIPLISFGGSFALTFFQIFVWSYVAFFSYIHPTWKENLVVRLVIFPITALEIIDPIGLRGGEGLFFRWIGYFIFILLADFIALYIVGIVISKIQEINNKIFRIK